jgi:hypothetical protein
MGILTDVHGLKPVRMPAVLAISFSTSYQMIALCFEIKPRFIHPRTSRVIILSALIQSVPKVTVRFHMIRLLYRTTGKIMHCIFVNIIIYRTIIFPVALYGCQTWSLALREEHGLRVFENRVLRRIFGPRRDEVTVGWNCMTRSFVICIHRQV